MVVNPKNSRDYSFVGFLNLVRYRNEDVNFRGLSCRFRYSLILPLMNLFLKHCDVNCSLPAVPWFNYRWYQSAWCEHFESSNFRSSRVHAHDSGKNSKNNETYQVRFSKIAKKSQHPPVIDNLFHASHAQNLFIEWCTEESSVNLLTKQSWSCSVQINEIFFLQNTPSRNW